MTVSYDGNFQYWGLSGTNIGNSTHIPLISIQDPAPNRHIRIASVNENERFWVFFLKEASI